MIDTLKKMCSPRVKQQILWCLYAPRIPRDVVLCLFWGVSYAKGLCLVGMPRIQQRKRKSIRFGKNVKLVSHWRGNSIGVFQKTILKTNRPGARILLGDNVGISGATLSATTAIIIGNDVLIGSGALLTDSDAHPLHVADREDGDKIRTMPIYVKNGVFIGARSIILKGVTLGEGCVVGAGSVVAKDVDPYTVVAGNPAVPVKTLERGQNV